MQNDSIDNLRLDLNKKSVRGVIYVRSGDTRARTIHITLTNNGSVVDLSDAHICEILIHKPDGTENDQAVVRYGNELQYTLRTTDINVPGECNCQIMVTFNDATVVTSPEFSIMVYQKTIDQSLEKSTNEYTAISQQVIEATNLRNQAAQDADRAETAREGVENYAEICKQYSEDASDSASNAALSEGNAAISADSASADKDLTKEYRDDAETFMEETRTNLAAVEDKATEILNYDSSAKQSAEDAADSATAAYNSEVAAASSAAAVTGFKERSEAYAVGTIDGDPVSSDDPAYHNNSKYYSDLAVATLNNKVDKEEGKGLSSNDFTDSLKTKLDNIESGAEVNVQADWNQSDNTADDYIKNKPSTLGHTIQNPSGTTMTQRANMQFTGNASVTDDSVNDKTIINIPDSGHEIVDGSGTTLTQEDALQFPDSFISDDSLNGRTVVENIKAVTQAQYPSQTEDGTYLITDGEGSVIEPASEDYVEVEADGDKTYAQLFAELWTKIDTSKVTGGAFLSLDKSNPYSAFYKLRSATSSAVSFVKENANTSNPYVTIEMVYISANFNALRISNPSSYSDADGNVKPSQGTVITLYYGNKKATVDLQTTANRCWYDSSKTVKDVLTTVDTLYDGTLTQGNSATLSKSIANYRQIVIEFAIDNDISNSGCVQISIVSPRLNVTYAGGATLYLGDDAYNALTTIKFTDNTHIEYVYGYVKSWSNKMTVKRVIGVQ